MYLYNNNVNVQKINDTYAVVNVYNVNKLNNIFDFEIEVSDKINNNSKIEGAIYNIEVTTQDDGTVTYENQKTNENGKIKEASNGHGGIFQSMLKEGIIYDMKARGIEWVFIGGVDNVLVNMVDPILIGLAEAKNVLAAGKSIVKAGPEEKVGVFCKKNGKPSVIEYSEISKEMAAERTENGELKYGESHILCNLFNIKAIDNISKKELPYHVAFKKAKYMDKNGEIVCPEKPNAYKFEEFLFDAFESLDDMAILRVKREDEFAPVKNAEGVDSPETARKLYTQFHSKNK